jgi:predicted esterase YcpF (UPF0227 family)
MIIYIHGFGSSAEGFKAKQFREYFKNRGERFIAPSLSYVPQLAINTLEDIIENCGSDVKLIGSSLGGFYALYLSEKYNLKVVLINPAVYADVTLKRAIGHGINYYDNSSYEWNAYHVKSLKMYKTTSVIQKNIMLLVQKGDDVLDYKEAVDFLPNSTLILEESGSHNFDGIDRYFKKIEIFFKN